MVEKQADANNIKKLAREIKGIDVAMVTTVARDGSLHSRPMVAQRKEFEGELWFFTSISSAKVEEIDADHRLNVVFVSPADHRYVSISGLGDIQRDRGRMRELWHPAVKTWFPAGPEDADLALLHVKPLVAEYWDVTTNRLVQLAGFVRSVITGEKSSSEENETVRF